MANPQTHDVGNTEAIYSVNAKWVNGIAPGYWPTAGLGLTLKLSAGTAFNAGAVVDYAGGTLTLPNNATSYVFLDPTASYAPASNTSGFPSTSIPIAVVITLSGAITSITDDRTPFIAPVALTQFSDAEIPSGSINGSNTSFTLAHAPNPPGSLLVESDGTLLAVGGVGFTLSGTSLSTTYAPVNSLLVWYRY